MHGTLERENRLCVVDGLVEKGEAWVVGELGLIFGVALVIVLGESASDEARWTLVEAVHAQV